MPTEITKRHSKGCPGHDGGRCNCGAGWEASVYSKRDGKKIRKVFAREAEAKSWRSDALSALAKDGLRAPKADDDQTSMGGMGGGRTGGNGP